jgi:hypothetical protein
LCSTACPSRLYWYWCSRWWKQDVLKQCHSCSPYTECTCQSKYFLTHFVYNCKCSDTETDLIMLQLVAVKSSHRLSDSIIWLVPKFQDVVMKVELWFGVVVKMSCFCEF